MKCVLKHNVQYFIAIQFLQGLVKKNDSIPKSSFFVNVKLMFLKCFLIAYCSNPYIFGKSFMFSVSYKNV